MTPHEIYLYTFLAINILFLILNLWTFKRVNKLETAVQEELAQATETIERFHKEAAQTNKYLDDRAMRLQESYQKQNRANVKLDASPKTENE